MWTGGLLLTQAVLSRHFVGTDKDIHERILALAATFERITEFVYAQETDCKSGKLLSWAGTLNKLSQHKMQLESCKQ